MKITTITPFNTDQRGFVAEYYHERIGQHLIVFSKAGAIRGRHYHKGLSITKNPEILILLSGSYTLNWREANTENIQTATVAAPAKIEIPAYTWHELVAITDCSFIELNALSEHAADVFYE